MIRTSVVGSHPPGELGPDAALERAVRDQWEAGIDVLSDGQGRADMISLFSQAIPGFSRTVPYCIDGPVGSPKTPIVLQDWLRAKELLAELDPKGERKVKAILTGPTTLAMACRLDPATPYGSNTDPRLVMDLAGVLAGEVQALLKAGAEIIQVDEPFFALGADLEIGMKALKGLLAGAPVPVLHVCGDLRPLGTSLLDAPAAILDIESSRGILPPWSPADLKAAGIAVGLGVVDSSSDRMEGEAEVREAVERGIAAFGRDNLAWLSPDCGLRLRRREAAVEKLRLMVRVGGMY